jgi:aryl-alcohol dehydrogenase-like predicted oxidoreductase
MTRLALGTVQFGRRYGLANTSGQVDAKSAAAILERARISGVDTLDTAVGYGNSESCLGEVGVFSWRVITKLPPVPEDITSVSEWVEAQVYGSLHRLRITRLDALLLHRPSDLFGPAGAGLIRAFDRLKARGLIRVAGISIYSPVELDAICAVWRPDLVQAPCNVLDRRLIHSGWLERLHGWGVPVHVRSLFLQGLLLMPAARRPSWFDPWTALLLRWTNWCDENKTTPLQATLAFAEAVPWVERLVVGVDSVNQWNDILAASDTKGHVPPDDLFSEDPELIEPSRWKLS